MATMIRNKGNGRLFCFSRALLNHRLCVVEEVAETVVDGVKETRKAIKESVKERKQSRVNPPGDKSND